MSKALLTSLLMLIAITASGQTLWQGAKAGMTPEEVVVSVPGAVMEPSRPDDQRDTQSLVRLASVEIAGATFKASFSFKNRGLVGVTLDTKTSGPDETDRVGRAVLEALRAKYGQELSRERNSIGSNYVWSSVKLEVIQIGSGWGLVNLLYSKRVSKDADKL